MIRWTTAIVFALTLGWAARGEAQEAEIEVEAGDEPAVGAADAEVPPPPAPGPDAPTEPMAPPSVVPGALDAGASFVLPPHGCPDGWVADGPRCLRTSRTPPIRWRARSEAVGYEAQLEVPCVAPRGGSCRREATRPELLGIGLGVFGLGYAGAVLIGALSWSNLGGEIAGYSFIPFVGPLVTAGVGAGAGFETIAVWIVGLPAMLGQLAGAVLTIVGAALDRTETYDAEGRRIEYAGEPRLLYAGPTGFGVAF